MKPLTVPCLVRIVNPLPDEEGRQLLIGSNPTADEYHVGLCSATNSADEAIVRTYPRAKLEEWPAICHRIGGPEDDDGELHERHSCPQCGAECDGDSPCRVMEVR